MKRDRYMDILRGILIILVIVGHSIADIERLTIPFNLIYSFHIPLLIFSSGYIEEDYSEKYLNKRSRMLAMRTSKILIPYFVWVFIDYIRNFGFPIDGRIYLARLLGYSSTGMWFLAVLFGLKCMHFFFWILKDLIEKKKKAGILLSCGLIIILEAILLVVACFSRFPYAINMLSYAIPYFSGVMIAQDDRIKRMMQSKFLTIVAIGIYVVGFYHFSFYNTGWITQVLRIGLSECVIVIVMYLKGSFIQTAGKMEGILAEIGRNSMAIYLLHWPFLDYKALLAGVSSGFIAGVMSILLSFTVAIICIVISSFLRKLPYMGQILFGDAVVKNDGK